LGWNIKEADRRGETPEKEFTDVRPHSEYNNIALFYAQSRTTVSTRPVAM